MEDRPKAMGSFVSIKDKDGEWHVVNVHLIQEVYFPKNWSGVHIVGANYTIVTSREEYNALMEAVYNIS